MNGRRHDAMRAYLEGLFSKWLAIDRTGDQDAKPTKVERERGVTAAATAMRELSRGDLEELTLDV